VPLVHRFLAVLALAIAIAPSQSFAASAGPQPSMTGVPAFGSEPAEGLCVQCHNSFPVNPDAAGTLTVEGVPAEYEPGHSYTLTVKLASSEKTVLRWGFQMTAVAMADGSGAGEFVATDPSTTQVISAMSGTRSYIEHNYGGTAIGQTGGTSWTFDWKAPATSVGAIGFFAAGNTANADGSNQGDRIYSHSPSPLAQTTPAAH
jgi:hypothetical protein